MRGEIFQLSFWQGYKYSTYYCTYRDICSSYEFLAVIDMMYALLSCLELVSS